MNAKLQSIHDLAMSNVECISRMQGSHAVLRENSVAMRRNETTFPFQSNQQLSSFFEEDGGFRMRCEKFEHHVLHAVHVNVKRKEVFCTTLFDCLFGSEYADQHEWPLLG